MPSIGIGGKKLQRYYRNKLSDYKDWKYKNSVYKGIICAENIDPYLSIDETCLSLRALHDSLE